MPYHCNCCVFRIQGQQYNKPGQDGDKNCFNAWPEKPCVQCQMWRTGLVTLALHRTGNPKCENLTVTRHRHWLWIKSLASFYQWEYLEDLFSVTIDSDSLFLTSY